MNARIKYQVNENMLGSQEQKCQKSKFILHVCKIVDNQIFFIMITV